MRAATYHDGNGAHSAGATGAEATALSDLISTSPAVRQSIRILVADDERILRDSCASVLNADGYHVTTTGRGREALDLLQTRVFDIVLLDLYMSDVPGMELLRTALGTHPDTIAIVITGKPSVESSLEVLRAGATDYLPKPFTGTQLQIMVGRAAHAVIVARETRAQESSRPAGGNSDKVLLLGTAPPFRAAIEQARKVAPTNASVFITGESGAGKELIAQFIHAHSHRNARPLIAVNCAALPEPLLESEMFGHVKGAFTGAIRDKAGLLEMANGGTLFLDELIEMATPIQAKLLRVIQDGVVRRVGSENTDAVINTRFIAATNRDPAPAGAARRYPPPGSVFSRALLARAPGWEGNAADLDEGGDVGAARLSVARECARAAERDRARGRAARAGGQCVARRPAVHRRCRRGARAKCRGG